MEHIKEDWKVKENDNGLLSIPIEDGLIISATRPEHQVGLTPEQAHLIASAPNLYEACKLVSKRLRCRARLTRNEEDVLTLIDEALAKAEGK